MAVAAEDHVMLRSGRSTISLWTGCGLLALLLSQGCGPGKYKTVVDAAESGLGSLTLADDYRHQRQLQQVLLEDPAFVGLTLTAYVFMDHGYVVGHVRSAEQAEAVFQAARTVEGLRSLNAFLPIKRTADLVGEVVPDEVLKEKIQAG